MTDPLSPKILSEHPCGEEVQVLSVQAQHRKRSRICRDCPWRRDAVPGTFPAEAFRHSADTAYDLSTKQFGCHNSGAQHPQACIGFLLQGATHNLAARMNPTDPETLDDDGAELYSSYIEMAVANGVDPDDPVLAPCRDD